MSHRIFLVKLPTFMKRMGMFDHELVGNGTYSSICSSILEDIIYDYRNIEKKWFYKLKSKYGARITYAMDPYDPMIFGYGIGLVPPPSGGLGRGAGSPYPCFPPDCGQYDGDQISMKSNIAFIGRENRNKTTLSNACVGTNIGGKDIARGNTSPIYIPLG